MDDEQSGRVVGDGKEAQLKGARWLLETNALDHHLWCETQFVSYSFEKLCAALEKKFVEGAYASYT